MIQRQFHRVNYRMPAVVNLAYGTNNVTQLTGEVCDISVSGLRIVLSDGSLGSLGPGAKARVLLQKNGSSACLEVTGSVVRSVAKGPGPQELAIRFDRVRYDVVAALSTHNHIVVELNPYGWTDYRMVLNSEQ